MRVACVPVLAPESAGSLHERPALQLAPPDGGLVGRERELAELTDAIEAGVPAIWISNRAPKLGWCWAGNPHTWLGSASCSDRAAA